MSREKTSRQTVLPPETPREPRPSDGIHFAPAEADAVVLSADLPPELEFDPVPHCPKSAAKFTPERQRMFVNALAACGSVTASAGALGISLGQVYHLRQRPGGESFAAAWEKAVRRGALRVRDVLVDQAINGIPETVYGPDGQPMLERRRFNTRMMMWIVAHHLPEQYGVAGGLMHAAGAKPNLARLKDSWRKQWAQEQEQARASQHERDAESSRTAWSTVREAFKRSLAADPEKRAAWELLTGPTDWTDLTALPSYRGLPDFNIHRPDVVVTAAGLGVPKRVKGEGG